MASDLRLVDSGERHAVKAPEPRAEVPRVLALINEAYKAAAGGDMDNAITHFCAARSELQSYVNPQRLAAAISSTDKKLSDESHSFEELAARQATPGGRQTVLLSDSLGLPRDGADEADCFEKTYAGLILRARRGSVQPIFKRLGTTSDVIDGLVNRANLAGANVLIHIGLNDCAVRMFQENDRIALTLVSEFLRGRFLQFIKVYRPQIVLSNLDYTYTPLDVFRNRLCRSIEVTQEKRAEHVTIATIVQPPEVFEQRTPKMAWNFDRYNSVIIETAKQFNITLIDINDLCNQNNKEKVLSKDGMHLSALGHKLMAGAYLEATSA